MNSFCCSEKACCSSAFLVLYFGPLPDYFKYWAKTCEPNHETCHFFVYTDQTKSKYQYNKAVTIIPYTFEQLCRDAAARFDIHIPAKNTRIACDCRLLLFGLRRGEENLDQYDLVGYTDLDVIYGKICNFLPLNPKSFSMISAHDNRPCGPFTLYRKSVLDDICTDKKIKAFFESSKAESFYSTKSFTDSKSKFMPMSGNSVKDRIAHSICFTHLDESDLLISIAMKHGPVCCRAHPLQPTMTGRINHRKPLALWHKGRLSVRDAFGRQAEGAVFHFSRFKNRSRFKVSNDGLDADRFGVYKYGITSINSGLASLRLHISMLY